MMAIDESSLSPSAEFSLDVSVAKTVGMLRLEAVVVLPTVLPAVLCTSISRAGVNRIDCKEKASEESLSPRTRRTTKFAVQTNNTTMAMPRAKNPIKPLQRIFRLSLSIARTGMSGASVDVLVPFEDGG